MEERGTCARFLTPEGKYDQRQKSLFFVLGAQTSEKPPRGLTSQATTAQQGGTSKMTTAAHASLLRAMNDPSEAVSPMCLFLQSINGGTSSSSAQLIPSASSPMENVSAQSSQQTTMLSPLRTPRGRKDIPYSKLYIKYSNPRSAH